MRRRVVITGMGTVNSLAANVADFWRRLCAGESGIGLIEQFDTTQFKVHFGGEVKDFRPEDHLDPKTARRLKTGEINSVLGPSAQITAHVEITSDPLVIDIDRKLPWYAELAKRQKGHLIISRPGEFQLVYNMFVGDGL